MEEERERDQGSNGGREKEGPGKQWRKREGDRGSNGGRERDRGSNGGRERRTGEAMEEA
jgi:hypothetical protein